ncbi:unnamed protein product [Caenorhabditis bovis]|uniref:Uncharacterized protein n=1 Tax=Caenorhabditis bovis TaxID=2654633 RepID=A0A8S1EPA1_9PELO|nr:unnamed protein product [Caenorhabditis bovis]
MPSKRKSKNGKEIVRGMKKRKLQEVTTIDEQASTSTPRIIIDDDSDESVDWTTIPRCSAPTTQFPVSVSLSPAETHTLNNEIREGTTSILRFSRRSSHGITPSRTAMVQEDQEIIQISLDTNLQPSNSCSPWPNQAPQPPNFRLFGVDGTLYQKSRLSASAKKRMKYNWWSESDVIKSKRYALHPHPFNFETDEILKIQHGAIKPMKTSHAEKVRSKVKRMLTARRDNNCVVSDNDYFAVEFLMTKRQISVRLTESRDVPEMDYPPLLDAGYFPFQLRKTMPISTLYEWHMAGRHIHGFYQPMSLVDDPEKFYLVDQYNFFYFPLYVEYEKWDARLKFAYDLVTTYNLHLSEVIHRNFDHFDSLNLLVPYDLRNTVDHQGPYKVREDNDLRTSEIRNQNIDVFDGVVLIVGGCKLSVYKHDYKLDKISNDVVHVDSNDSSDLEIYQPENVTSRVSKINTSEPSTSKDNSANVQKEIEPGEFVNTNRQRFDLDDYSQQHSMLTNLNSSLIVGEREKNADDDELFFDEYVEIMDDDYQGIGLLTTPWKDKNDHGSSFINQIREDEQEAGPSEDPDRSQISLRNMNSDDSREIHSSKTLDDVQKEDSSRQNLSHETERNVTQHKGSPDAQEVSDSSKTQSDIQEEASSVRDDRNENVNEAAKNSADIIQKESSSIEHVIHGNERDNTTSEVQESIQQDAGKEMTLTKGKEYDEVQEMSSLKIQDLEPQEGSSRHYIIPNGCNEMTHVSINNGRRLSAEAGGSPDPVESFSFSSQSREDVLEILPLNTRENIQHDVSKKNQTMTDNDKREVLQSPSNDGMEKAPEFHFLRNNLEVIESDDSEEEEAIYESGHENERAVLQFNAREDTGIDSHALDGLEASFEACHMIENSAQYKSQEATEAGPTEATEEHVEPSNQLFEEEAPQDNQLPFSLLKLINDEELKRTYGYLLKELPCAYEIFSDEMFLQSLSVIYSTSLLHLNSYVMSLKESKPLERKLSDQALRLYHALFDQVFYKNGAWYFYSHEIRQRHGLNEEKVFTDVIISRGLSEETSTQEQETVATELPGSTSKSQSLINPPQSASVTITSKVCNYAKASFTTSMRSTAMEANLTKVPDEEECVLTIRNETPKRYSFNVKEVPYAHQECVGAFACILESSAIEKVFMVPPLDLPSWKPPIDEDDESHQAPTSHRIYRLEKASLTVSLPKNYQTTEKEPKRELIEPVEEKRTTLSVNTRLFDDQTLLDFDCEMVPLSEEYFYDNRVDEAENDNNYFGYSSFNPYDEIAKGHPTLPFDCLRPIYRIETAQLGVTIRPMIVDLDLKIPIMYKWNEDNSREPIKFEDLKNIITDNIYQTPYENETNVGCVTKRVFIFFHKCNCKTVKYLERGPPVVIRDVNDETNWIYEMQPINRVMVLSDADEPQHYIGAFVCKHGYSEHLTLSNTITSTDAFTEYIDTISSCTMLDEVPMKLSRIVPKNVPHRVLTLIRRVLERAELLDHFFDNEDFLNLFLKKEMDLYRMLKYGTTDEGILNENEMKIFIEEIKRMELLAVQKELRLSIECDQPPIVTKKILWNFINGFVHYAVCQFFQSITNDSNNVSFASKMDTPATSSILRLPIIHTPSQQKRLEEEGLLRNSDDRRNQSVSLIKSTPTLSIQSSATPRPMTLNETPQRSSNVLGRISIQTNGQQLNQQNSRLPPSVRINFRKRPDFVTRALESKQKSPPAQWKLKLSTLQDAQQSINRLGTNTQGLMSRLEKTPSVIVLDNVRPNVTMNAQEKAVQKSSSKEGSFKRMTPPNLLGNAAGPQLQTPRANQLSLQISSQNLNKIQQKSLENQPKKVIQLDAAFISPTKTVPHTAKSNSNNDTVRSNARKRKASQFEEEIVAKKRRKELCVRIRHAKVPSKTNGKNGKKSLIQLARESSSTSIETMNQVKFTRLSEKFSGNLEDETTREKEPIVSKIIELAASLRNFGFRKTSNRSANKHLKRISATATTPQKNTVRTASPPKTTIRTISPPRITVRTISPTKIAVRTTSPPRITTSKTSPPRIPDVSTVTKNLQQVAKTTPIDIINLMKDSKLEDINTIYKTTEISQVPRYFPNNVERFKHMSAEMKKRKMFYYGQVGSFDDLILLRGCPSKQISTHSQRRRSQSCSELVDYTRHLDYKNSFTVKEEINLCFNVPPEIVNGIVERRGTIRFPRLDNGIPDIFSHEEYKKFARFLIKDQRYAYLLDEKTTDEHIIAIARIFNEATLFQAGCMPAPQSNYECVYQSYSRCVEAIQDVLQFAEGQVVSLSKRKNRRNFLYHVFFDHVLLVWKCYIPFIERLCHCVLNRIFSVTAIYYCSKRKNATPLLILFRNYLDSIKDVLKAIFDLQPALDLYEQIRGLPNNVSLDRLQNTIYGVGKLYIERLRPPQWTMDSDINILWKYNMPDIKHSLDLLVLNNFTAVNDPRNDIEFDALSEKFNLPRFNHEFANRIAHVDRQTFMKKYLVRAFFQQADMFMEGLEKVTGCEIDLPAARLYISGHLRKMLDVVSHRRDVPADVHPLSPITSSYLIYSQLTYIEYEYDEIHAMHQLNEEYEDLVRRCNYAPMVQPLKTSFFFREEPTMIVFSVIFEEDIKLILDKRMRADRVARNEKRLDYSIHRRINNIHYNTMVDIDEDKVWVQLSTSTGEPISRSFPIIAQKLKPGPHNVISETYVLERADKIKKETIYTNEDTQKKLRPPGYMKLLKSKEVFPRLYPKRMSVLTRQREKVVLASTEGHYANGYFNTFGLALKHLSIKEKVVDTIGSSFVCVHSKIPHHLVQNYYTMVYPKPVERKKTNVGRKKKIDHIMIEQQEHADGPPTRTTEPYAQKEYHFENYTGYMNETKNVHE